MFKFAYLARFVVWLEWNHREELRREAKRSWPSGGLTLPRLLKNEGGKPRCSKKITVQHKDLKLV